MNVPHIEDPAVSSKIFALVSADLFLKTDSDGVISFASGDARLLNTVDARSLVLSNLFQLLRVSDINSVRRAFAQIEIGQRVSFDDPSFKPDGRRISIARSPDTPNEITVAIADLKAHKQLECDAVEESHIRAFRSALISDDLKAARQPIVNTQTGAVSHHEILVRFPFEGSPGPIIASAEKRGLISELDCLMMDATAAYLSLNTENAHKLALNMSGDTLQNPEVADELVRIIRGYDFDPSRLILEITESSEIHDIDAATNSVAKLHDCGAKIVLDDFGAGAASFGYLRSLNVDGVKFDGCFLSNPGQHDRNTALLRSISGMCRELGMTAVGERVETEQDRQTLLDAGVTLAQGYFFGRPQIDEGFFAARTKSRAAA